MKFLCICVFLPTIALAATLGSQSQMISSPRLESIGQVGNKMYYLGSDPVNWESADKNCTSVGASLANVETEAERTFLKVVLDAIPNGHWTSGRDVRTGAQFQWKNGGQEGLLDENAVSGLHGYSCLVYVPATATLTDVLCTESRRFLCHTTV